MKKMKKWSFMFLLLSLLMMPAAYALAQDVAQGSEDGETILVGRVAHVEGSVFRYVPEEGDWVRIVTDAPFGLEDKLRTREGGRAEIILPNNTWDRMDEATHLQLLSLGNDRTDIHMVHGTARFYNKGSDSVIRVTTPFASVSNTLKVMAFGLSGERP